MLVVFFILHLFVIVSEKGFSIYPETLSKIHPVSFTNKVDRHDITEILLKVT